MKTTYRLTLLLVLPFFSASAQNEFYNTQKFNRSTNSRPLIGFDLIRKQNPLIIIQAGDNAEHWYNMEKYTTTPFVSGNLYTETGYYSYELATKKWRPARVDAYDITYDAGHNKVLEAVQHVTNEMSNYYAIFRYKYEFGALELPTRETAEQLNNGVYSPYSTTTFTYDSIGNVDTLLYEFYSGFSFRTTYSYDRASRLLRELSLTSNGPGEPWDSSSRVSYQYDSVGQLIMYKAEIYDVAGSPFAWTTSRKISYGYDFNGRLQGNQLWSYDYLNNYTEVKTFDYAYNCDASGRLSKFEVVAYNRDGSLSSKDMLNFINDPTGLPLMAFEHNWKGTEYDPMPVYRYLFRESLTGLESVSISAQPMAVFPNPCKDIIRTDGEAATLSICDLAGKTIKTVAQATEIETADLQPGMYLLLVGDQKPVKFSKE